MKIKAIDKLKDSEVLFLEEFVRDYPRHWQDKARAVIDEGGGSRKAELFLLFKRHGEYIDRISVHDIKRAAELIVRNRSVTN